MTNYAGRKFKIIELMGGEPDAFYGAQVGDVLTLSNYGSETAWPESIWASRVDNPGKFTSEGWESIENFCVANNENDLAKYFKEVK